MTEPHLDFNYTTYLVCLPRILVWMSPAYFRYGTYILTIKIWNRLRDCFTYKFVLLRHILVGYTNVYFCDKLNFNTFSRTFVHFTIFVLTWNDFTSYSILLSMSISARAFHTLSMCFRCIIWFNTKIEHTGFGIIELWPYLLYCHVILIAGFYSYCLWLMSDRFTERTWIVIM